jgi:phosphate transport system protein
MPTHYEQSMERDISRIRGKVAEMARLAEASLDACLRALTEGNRQLAYAIILRDRRIDELEKEIDRLCLEFIVRQQPVAFHLRFAYVTIKINQEVERIGDYAESIARQILKVSKLGTAPPLERYRQIAGLTIPMLHNAVRAYLEEDAALARRTMSVEEEVDALKSIINRELYELCKAERIPLEALTPLMTIARRFERASDQARNICEETLYMVTGEYQKHPGENVWRMVFIDDDHACLSLMAEAVANAMEEPEFVFLSAGMKPGPVDPALEPFLQEKGISLPHALSRSVDKVPNFEFAQVLVALTKEARKAFPTGTRAVCLDWPVPDPSKLSGTPEERHAAYQAAYEALQEHLHDLVQGVLSDKFGAT